MKKDLIVTTVLVSFAALCSAQVGINTDNPKGVLHIDGKSSATTTNPSTGTPTAIQASDDFVVTSSGATSLGTLLPDSSAMLDIYSSNKGILIPRVNLTSNTLDLDGVAGQATGLLVYNTGNTTVTEGYYYWDGGQWKQMLAGAVDPANTATIATVGPLDNFVSGAQYYRQAITPDGKFAFRVLRTAANTARVEYKSIGATRIIRIMVRLENGNNDAGDAATITATADTWMHDGIDGSGYGNTPNSLNPGVNSYPLSRIYFTTTDPADKVIYNTESQYYETTTPGCTAAGCTGTKVSIKILQTTGK